MNNEERLQNLLKNLTGSPAPIPLDVSLREAGVDSLKTMELIILIEDTFELQIPDEFLTVEYLGSVEAILKLIARIQAA